jgi:hypothetical protein
VGGYLTVSAAGTTTLSGPVSLAGTTALTGDLSITGKSLTITGLNGTLSVAAGTTTLTGPISVAGTTTFANNSVSITGLNGALSVAAGTSTLTGPVSIVGTQAVTGTTTFGTSTKLQFRETGQYIYSDAANSLTIAAGSTQKTLFPFVGVNETVTGITGNVTLLASHSGNVYAVWADSVVTLPAATTALTFTFISPSTGAAMTLAPSANELVCGSNTVSGAANNYYVQTKGSVQAGDYIVITGCYKTGWFIQRKAGTWKIGS